MTPRQLAELAQEDGRGAVDKLHAFVAQAYSERDEALARADKLAQLVQAAVLIADRVRGTTDDAALYSDCTDLILQVEALSSRGMRDRIPRRLGLDVRRDRDPGSR